MRSQQKERVKRNVAQYPVKDKENQDRVYDPRTQGKRRFPEQDTDQDQGRKQKQIITERRGKISVESRIKRPCRPASGAVKPRQPVKGTLRQPARRNRVMKIQEHQSDSADGSSGKKKQNLNQAIRFYFSDRIIFPP